MSMIGTVILLFALGLFVVLGITFLRLLFEDCDAVEIELRQVEKWDSEAPQLDSE